MKENSIDMSTCTFFIRVSTFSIKFLTLAMSSVYEARDGDWGSDITGAAMQGVLEREEWTGRGVWVPREWFIRADDGLGKIRKEQGEGWEVYPRQQEVDNFWNKINEAEQVLVEAKDRGYTSESGGFEEEIGDLKDAVELWSWDVEGMGRKMERLKEVLGIGEIVGRKAVVG
jgi:hypothetical protein